MYKIFINNIPVYLTDDKQQKSTAKAKSIWRIKYSKKTDLLAIIQLLEQQPPIEEVYIVGKKIKPLYKAFVAHYKPIPAAGGGGFNDQGGLLLIYRHKKWDLPKGKVEENETIDSAAVREVEEETGLENVAIVEELSFPSNQFHITYHTFFNSKGKRILKTTYWYRMSCSGNSHQLKPQAEEGIEEVRWVSPAHIKPYFNNTFLSIVDTIKVFLKD